MTEQELIDRLRLSLDTLENDSEIANAVRRIRRLKGKGAFATPGPSAPRPPPPTDRVQIYDSREDVARGMRALAFKLKTMHTVQPCFLQEVTNVLSAISLNAVWMEGRDVRATFAAISLLLDWLREQHTAMRMERDSYRDTYHAMAAAKGGADPFGQAAQASAWSAAGATSNVASMASMKDQAIDQKALHEAMMNLSDRFRR